MFNIGPQELLLILVLALLVVGPKRLPEIARTVGKGFRELRKAQDEVKKTIQVNLDEPSPSPTRSRTPRKLPVDEPAPTSSADGGTDPASSTSGVEVAAAAAAAGATVTDPSAVGEVSRSLGRTLAELRRAREEVRRSFRVDLDGPAASTRASTPTSSGTASSEPPAAAPPASGVDEPTPSPGSTPDDDDRPS